MRIAASALALAAVLALAGCSAATPAAAPAPAVTTTAPAVATTAPPQAVLASLPSAPPVGTWVVKGSDFQETLDLRMETELIKLGIAPALGNESAARDLAYMICTAKRTGATADAVQAAVQDAYPTADQYSRLSVILTASSYCVDTV